MLRLYSIQHKMFLEESTFVLDQVKANIDYGRRSVRLSLYVCMHVLIGKTLSNIKWLF